MSELTIRYHGHSCFTLIYNGFRTVLDPYSDGSVPGLKPLRITADACFCSHTHGDHNGSSSVTLFEPGKEPPFTVQTLSVPHDGQNGALRGMNLIHKFTFNDLTVVHFGDLGRKLTDEEAEQLSEADCVLIPVGGYFTISAAEAKQIISQIRPKVVIPMHYRTETSGYDVIGTLQDFLQFCKSYEKTGSEYTLTKQDKEIVLVMKGTNEGE